MTLSQSEYEEIMNDDAKVIEGDITWTASDNPRAQTFRVDVEYRKPLFVQGWYNLFPGSCPMLLSTGAKGESMASTWGLTTPTQTGNV